GDGLDVRGGPDGALLDAEAVLGVDEDLVPQPGLLRGLELRQVEVRAGAVADEVAGVVEEVQAEVDECSGGRELLAVVVDVEQMLLGQVPAAGTQSDGRLVVIADTGQLAADGAVEVELTADDIGPGRARGVFEIGQPHLGLGVQGSHDFGFGHGTGEFDAAVLETGSPGGAGDGPGPVGPDAGGLGLEPRQGPAVHLGRTGPARAQQLADGAGEL